jgi:hypothetical protein
MIAMINIITTAANDVAADLAGYAARDAINTLAANWRDAAADSFWKDDVQARLSMSADIDATIRLLVGLQSGLLDRPDAHGLMRPSLGL